MRNTTKTVLYWILLPIRLLLWLLLSPIVTVGYFVLILLFGIPSQLFRKFISFIAHCLDDDLEKLVTATSNIPARDFQDWCTKPSQSITVLLKFKGRIDLQTLRQHVHRTLVHKWNADKEQLEYPELQQYCTKRLGYLFFKWDRQFDIANHVKVYKSWDIKERTVLTDEKLRAIWEKVARRPYMPKRSPWEFLLVDNYLPEKVEEKIGLMEIKSYESLPKEEQRQVVFLRVHHSLMDGYSVYRLLLCLTDDGVDQWDMEMAEKLPPKCYSFMLYLKALVLDPSRFTFEALRGVDAVNPLHYQKRKLTGKYFVVESCIDVELVKKVKKLHRVSFSSVLIAGIAGGIRNYVRKIGLKLPFLPIRIGMPIPRPGHSNKLRNEWLTSMTNLPVNAKSGRERLQQCFKNLNELAHGSFTPFLSLSTTVIGGFPVQWIRHLTCKSGITVLYSEMKVPTKLVYGMNKTIQLEDLVYSFGLGTDDLGIGYSIMTYNGKVHIVLTLDQGIFHTREKAEQLLHFIVKEIEEFQYGDSTNL